MSQFYVMERPAHSPTFPEPIYQKTPTEVIKVMPQPQIIKTPHRPLQDIDRGNIFTFIESNPHNHPDDRPQFVRVADGKAFTRGQVFGDARRLAHVFKHKLKAAEGSTIAIFSPNTAIYPIAVYAGFISGVVITPLSPAYNAEELVHPLVDSGAQFILAHPAVAKTAQEAVKLANLSEECNGMSRIWLLDDADAMAEVPLGGALDVRTLMTDEKLEPIQVKDHATRTALLCYSSGTSGRPKGVEITHRNMTAVTEAEIDGLKPDFTEKDTILGVLPFQHIFGMAMFLHLATYIGMPVVVMPRFDLHVFLGAVSKYKITAGMVVPPILVLLAKDPNVLKYDLSSLRVLLSGAAPLSAALGDEVEARIPTVKVTQGYGLTETSPTATYSPTTHYGANKGSCGRLLPCVEARLVNDNGDDVGHEQGETGQPGELWLRGPTIMKGYLKNEVATREAITADGWFKTGDVAIYKGDHFFIVDRKKELIKYKGFQVAPADVEAMLLTHPKVADAAVIGVYKADEATELPRAYIVPIAGSGIDVTNAEHTKAFATEVRQWFDARVANYKKLRGGIIVEAKIEKSPSGKILRRIYRDRIIAEAKANES